MNDEQKNIDFRLQTVNSSEIENRSFLFWGFDRGNIKRTSLYKQFIENNKELSFYFGDKVFVIKNELLTQTHKDVLEALIMLCDISSDVEHVVSHTSILDVLQKNSKNVVWLDFILEELNNVNFRFFIKSEKGDNVNAIGFKILDTLGIDDDTGFISFSFSKNFLSLYKQGRVFNYSKYTPFIANLDHDISKQVVRWLLTFDNLQIDIKNLLTVKLGLLNVVNKSTLNKYIVHLKDEDLSMFGIWFDGNNICIDRACEVDFFDGVTVDKLKGVKKVVLKQSSLPFFDLK
ncbi:MAG: hypothetical protein LWW95_10180 [Candidatus Desulfofervidus auxilii]|nr:hypothetical protein [Candidatus Desulfofervidus auxilii]